MTRNQWKKRLVFPGIILFLIALWVCGSLLFYHACKNSGKSIHPTGLRNARMESTVNHSEQVKRAGKNFQRLATNTGRLLADFRGRVSDVKDGCLSMCYDAKINPHEWLRCLVRSWGVTGISH